MSAREGGAHRADKVVIPGAASSSPGPRRVVARAGFPHRVLSARSSVGPIFDRSKLVTGPLSIGLGGARWPK